MKESIYQTTDTWIISIILFILIVLFIILGIKMSLIRKVNKSDDDANSYFTNAIFAVMGLVLAFTYNMSGSRFDSRKKIIMEEANCISTAVLRSDMYPDSIRTLFRNDFKDYLDQRIIFYEARRDIPRVRESLIKSDEIGDRLWLRASELSKNVVYFAQTNQMIPALNNMFDEANTRLNDELYRLPDPIINLLFAIILIASFLLGYSSNRKGKIDWYIAICYAMISVMIIYLILDLDKPRTGLINMDDSQMAILRLKEMFK